MATTTTPIAARVQAVVAEELGVHPDEVALSAHLRDDLGADSLDALELALALEDAFAIQIPDQDVDRLHTVQALVTYVETAVGGMR